MKELDKLNIKKIQIWAIYILIILNIIAFILLSDKIYFRLDLTKGNRFSVSKPTVELIRKINKENPLIIQYYYNDKFKQHSGMAPVAQYVEDILNEYDRSSRGSVEVIIKELSYEKDAALIDDLEKMGIMQFPLSEREKAESKTLLGISGITLKHEDKFSIIPIIYSDTGFEYNLDLEIKKLIEKDRGTLGIINTISSRPFESEYTVVNTAARNAFSDVKMIASGENIPPEVSVLMIIGGEGLTDYDIFQIDQFLMNGGKAFIALGGINIIMNPQYGMFGMPNESKLFDLLAHYGMKINIDMIGDNDSFNPYMQQGDFGYTPYRYPVWPRITSLNVNKNHPSTDGLEGLNLFWASSIDIDDKIKNNAVSLFHTTENSWTEKENFQIAVEQYMYQNKQGEKSFNMGYAFKGKLESYFKEKDVPENKDGTGKFTGNKLDQGETQMIVMGNDFFLWDKVINSDQDSQIFLMNSFDSFSKDQSLIEIRKKGKFNKPLDRITNDSQFKFRKNIIIIASTFIVPLLFIALAIIVYLLRNIKNKKIKTLY